MVSITMKRYGKWIPSQIKGNQGFDLWKEWNYIVKILKLVVFDVNLGKGRQHNQLLTVCGWCNNVRT